MYLENKLARLKEAYKRWPKGNSEEVLETQLELFEEIIKQIKLNSKQR